MRLLISGLQVRVLPGAPTYPKEYYMLSNYPEPWAASTWIIYLLVLGCYFGVLYVLSVAERINYGESDDD
jgi:hypothetical protein